jgi:hypothetical protein
MNQLQLSEHVSHRLLERLGRVPIEDVSFELEGHLSQLKDKVYNRLRHNVMWKVRHEVVEQVWPIRTARVR